MMPIFLQEGVLVSVIILVQLIIFAGAARKINIFKRIIPAEDKFSITRVRIPLADIERADSPKDLIGLIQTYLWGGAAATRENGMEPEAELQLSDAPVLEIPVIDTTTAKEPVFQQILDSLNTYLVRNKGSVADFNLVKDIVDRNTDALDNDIRISLPLPLYLGLMGTMLGIVIGLFNMPDLSADIFQGAENTLNEAEAGNFTDGMNILLGGVRIAMIASFVGLLLTTVNSGLFYKGSKARIEHRKNGFFTFLQTQLLPLLSQNVTANMFKLQQSFDGFNLEFAGNLNRLEGLVKKNNETITSQYHLIKMLEESDFSNLIKANVLTFDKIQRSIAELDRSSASIGKFSEYLNQINEFVGQSQQLNTRMNMLLERTNGFQAIAQKVEGTLDESRQLQRFLNSHFDQLGDRSQLINNAVAKVDVVLDKSLDDLKAHVEEKIRTIRNFTTSEQVKVEEMLSANADNLKRFFEGMQEKIEHGLKQNADQAHAFFSEMQSKMADTFLENQAAFEKLNQLQALNVNFEEFISEQKKTNSRLNQNLELLRDETKAVRTIGSNLAASTITSPAPTRMHQIRNGVNWAFQILAIVFFVTMLVYFMVQWLPS